MASSVADDDATKSTPTASVVLDYSLTRTQIVAFSRWYLLRQWGFKACTITIVTLLIAGIALSFTGTGDAGIPFLVIGLLTLTVFVAEVLLAPGKAWRKLSKRMGDSPRHVTITDEGIREETANADARLKWAAFSEVILLGDMYAVRMAHGRNYAIIPRSAFRSESDEVMFREIARRNGMSKLSTSLTQR